MAGLAPMAEAMAAEAPGLDGQGPGKVKAPAATAVSVEEPASQAWRGPAALGPDQAQAKEYHEDDPDHVEAQTGRRETPGGAKGHPDQDQESHLYTFSPISRKPAWWPLSPAACQQKHH